MTTTTTWAEERALAIEGFNGELPTATTEQELIDAFQLEPVAVIHARDQVIDDYQAGKCRSGWAIWRKRVQAIHAPANPTVEISDRPKAIALAETWIRNAGGYVDNQAELVAHLFGPTELTPPIGYLEQLDEDTRDRPGRAIYTRLLQAAITETRANGPQEIAGTDGLLTRFDTPSLRHRMVTLWESQRPRFAAAEADAIERQHAHGEAYRRIRGTMRHHAQDVDIDEHAMRIHAEVERARNAYLASIAPDEDDAPPLDPPPE